MAKYKKLLVTVGPILLPLVVSGIRYLLRRKTTEEGGGEHGGGSKQQMLDTLIDTGVRAMTRGIRKS